MAGIRKLHWQALVVAFAGDSSEAVAGVVAAADAGTAVAAAAAAATALALDLSQVDASVVAEIEQRDSVSIGSSRGTTDES